MKIRVGIVDVDNSFVKRFSRILTTRHPDTEILFFPNIKSAKTAADKSLLDLLLVDSATYSNHSASIPASCKVAVIKDEKGDSSDESLPTVCKYQSVEEWYTAICGLCGFDERPVAGGGVGFLSNTNHDAVCLFLPGNGGTCATLAATAFCRFLAENGFDNTAAVETCFESGEDVWRMTEEIAARSGFVALCMVDWNNDNIVVPIINSGQIVLVTDGTRAANERIKRLIHDLPVITGESKKKILEKTALLYNGFDPKSGELLRNDELTKLGGLDSKRNTQAAFEKLVILCTKK